MLRASRRAPTRTLWRGTKQPPSLSAITPLSVYDDTARGVLAPGGIFNEGFALTWADEVLTNAKPAP